MPNDHLLTFCAHTHILSLTLHNNPSDISKPLRQDDIISFAMSACVSRQPVIKSQALITGTDCEKNSAIIRLCGYTGHTGRCFSTHTHTNNTRIAPVRANWQEKHGERRLRGACPTGTSSSCSSSSQDPVLSQASV